MQAQETLDFGDFGESGDGFAAANEGGVPTMQTQEEADPFATAAGAAGGFTVPGQNANAEDLTEEELELIQQVEKAEYDRVAKLQGKYEDEMNKKRERKLKAQEELSTMNSDRTRLIKQNQETNQINEKQFFEQRDEKRQGKNPWDRVVENCDFSTSSSAGGKDMSRMKQVMQARRADITKKGGMKAKDSMADMF